MSVLGMVVSGDLFVRSYTVDPNGNSSRLLLCPVE
jgi:hypothetical protein